MKENETLLKGITSEQLIKALEDENMVELIAKEITKMSYAFITKNVIHNLPIEDYAQELFMIVWERIKTFDETRGSFSTFCYCWFNCYRTYYIKKKKELLILDLPITEDENLFYIDELQSPQEESTTKIPKEELAQLLNNSSIEMQMWCGGNSQQEIANQLGVTQAQISRRLNKELNTMRKFINI